MRDKTHQNRKRDSRPQDVQMLSLQQKTPWAEPTPGLHHTTQTQGTRTMQGDNHMMNVNGIPVPLHCAICGSTIFEWTSAKMTFCEECQHLKKLYANRRLRRQKRAGCLAGRD